MHIRHKLLNLKSEVWFCLKILKKLLKSTVYLWGVEVCAMENTAAVSWGLDKNRSLLFNWVHHTHQSSIKFRSIPSAIFTDSSVKVDSQTVKVQFHVARGSQTSDPDYAWYASQVARQCQSHFIVLTHSTVTALIHFCLALGPSVAALVPSRGECVVFVPHWVIVSRTKLMLYVP